MTHFGKTEIPPADLILNKVRVKTALITPGKFGLGYMPGNNYNTKQQPWNAKVYGPNLTTLVIGIKHLFTFGNVGLLSQFHSSLPSRLLMRYPVSRAEILHRCMWKRKGQYITSSKYFRINFCHHELPQYSSFLSEIHCQGPNCQSSTNTVTLNKRPLGRQKSVEVIIWTSLGLTKVLDG